LAAGVIKVKKATTSGRLRRELLARPFLGAADTRSFDFARMIRRDDRGKTYPLAG
jgi:hypothetical protein